MNFYRDLVVSLLLAAGLIFLAGGTFTVGPRFGCFAIGVALIVIGLRAGRASR